MKIFLIAFLMMFFMSFVNYAAAELHLRRKSIQNDEKSEGQLQDIDLRSFMQEESDKLKEMSDSSKKIHDATQEEISNVRE